MISVVLLSLLVVTVVAGAIVMTMFVDVAFAGPTLSLISTGPSDGMQFGTRLKDFDGAGLARQVEQAVSRAMSGIGLKSTGSSTCSAACFQRQIQVTIPEVLAIVDELRERQPPAQVDAIRGQAQQNRMAGGTSNCPLLMSGGLCACQLARPVSCRTRCFAGGDSPIETRLLAQSMEMGVTETFRDCLNATGLDDSHYELNDALAQVLQTPDSAQRWARGEQIMKTATMKYHS